MQQYRLPAMPGDLTRPLRPKRVALHDFPRSENTKMPVLPGTIVFTLSCHQPTANGNITGETAI